MYKILEITKNPKVSFQLSDAGHQVQGDSWKLDLHSNRKRSHNDDQLLMHREEVMRAELSLLSDCVRSSSHSHLYQMYVGRTCTNFKAQQ